MPACDVLCVPKICTEKDADHDKSRQILVGCELEHEIPLFKMPYIMIGASLKARKIRIIFGSH
jgi:hypothetical protein